MVLNKLIINYSRELRIWFFSIKKILQAGIKPICRIFNFKKRIELVQILITLI